MNQEDAHENAAHKKRLETICTGFNMLTEDQQDYILGIMQALAFANNADNSSELKNHETENDEE